MFLRRLCSTLLFWRWPRGMRNDWSASVATACPSSVLARLIRYAHFPPLTSIKNHFVAEIPSRELLLVIECLPQVEPSVRRVFFHAHNAHQARSRQYYLHSPLKMFVSSMFLLIPHGANNQCQQISSLLAVLLFLADLNTGRSYS